MATNNRTAGTSTPRKRAAAKATKAAAKPDAPSEEKQSATIQVPFVSASITVPGPGAAVKVGPVAMTLPTGYLYYGGLGALALAGTIEWPVAATLAAGGFVVDRFRHRGDRHDGKHAD
ncbi:hypothetical protein FOS14_02825 [Skermania sp. ID1734]|uniref:hypothetical protein n=1 Tax=Skermania sp. ID1734 TaxID=2597516 RepID=UPI00117E85C6|nr:hypothetical protein [Skermania sp. ID1734]TSE01497.1 hypothetical protein FOS14_02825 [Skermania sp. ID1734]